MSKCLFSRSSHVAYQINGNGAWSTMQAHNYSVFTYTLDPSGGVTVKIHVLKVVMLHFKLKGMEDRAHCKHIFCPYTHPQPLGPVRMYTKV